jgi:hypothetical protein
MTLAQASEQRKTDGPQGREATGEGGERQSGRAARRRSGRRLAVPALAAAAVAGAVLFAFLPVLHNGFVPLDDPENFLSNPAYRGLGPAQLGWMWTARHMGHYIPLTWMTLGADYLLWGMDPAGYHRTSLALHLANALLLLALAWRLLELAWPAQGRHAGAPPGSVAPPPGAAPAGPVPPPDGTVVPPRAAAAALHATPAPVAPPQAAVVPSPAAVAAGAVTAALAFGVHPLRVESVAWVSERRDVLCGFFVLLTLLAYVGAKSAATAGRPGRRRGLLAAAAGLYAAALLSKGIAVALPVALVALDAVLPARAAGPRRPEGEGGTGLAGGWREPRPGGPERPEGEGGTGSAGGRREPGGAGPERPRSPDVMAGPGRVAWGEKLPFFALAAASAAVTLWASRPVLVPAARLGISARLAAAAYGLGFYLQHTFWPVHVPFLVPWLAGVELGRPAFAWRAAALGALAVALATLGRRSAAARAAAGALAVYAAFVLPVSGLLQAGPQLAAPRYSYLSCLPWALLAGAAVTRFLAGRRTRGGEEEARGERAQGEKEADGEARREAVRVGGRPAPSWRWAAALGVVAAASWFLVSATRREVGRWHDDFTFSAAGIASAPTAWAPRFTLARALLRAGRWREAAAQVRTGLAYSPAAVPLDVMGALLFATCPDGAVRSGPQALALAERAARATSYRGAAALEALAAAHAESGDFVRAREAAERALALCREHPRADPRVALRLAPALALYSRGRPLRLAAGDWS